MIDSILFALLYIIVFPGFVFLSAYGLFLQWFDRKLAGVMQNRVGPPWYQPLADLIKLLAKETIIPAACDNAMFRVLPYFAITDSSSSSEEAFNSSWLAPAILEARYCLNVKAPPAKTAAAASVIRN